MVGWGDAEKPQAGDQNINMASEETRRSRVKCGGPEARCGWRLGQGPQTWQVGGLRAPDETDGVRVEEPDH